MNEKKQTTTATIIIRLNGDETTATLIRDEFPTQTIRRTCARRNPADTYDAYEGARIALDRLYGKDPFPKEPVPEKPFVPSFQEGDLVRTRNDDVFVPGCRNRLARVRRVTRIEGTYPIVRYSLDVIRRGDDTVVQDCCEAEGSPAPMTLVFSGGKR